MLWELLCLLEFVEKGLVVLERLDRKLMLFKPKAFFPYPIADKLHARRDDGRWRMLEPWYLHYGIQLFNIKQLHFFEDNK